MNKLIKLSTSALAIALLSFMSLNCTGGNETGTTNTEKQATTIPINKPLNISIFIDLSDRLERDLIPTQKERDLCIVEHITKYYQNNTLGKGILDSKNKIQIFTYPTPKDQEINNLADSLTFDIEKLGINVERRIETERLHTRFNSNLAKIYDIAISQKNWVGCDIWDFFSSGKVDKQCMIDGYRNIMIILTDGYFYHENHKVKDGDAYSYILPKTLNITNSSLITKRQGLNNLEVLLLEVNPYQPAQRDKLVDVLNNWFKSMEVGKFEISETDLTPNTEKVINQFLNK